MDQQCAQEKHEYDKLRLSLAFGRVYAGYAVQHSALFLHALTQGFLLVLTQM